MENFDKIYLIKTFGLLQRKTTEILIIEYSILLSEIQRLTNLNQQIGYLCHRAANIAYRLREKGIKRQREDSINNLIN